MDEDVFCLIIQIFEKSENGELKGQKKGGPCSASTFKELRKLPVSEVKDLLCKVLNAEVKLTDIRTEAKALKELKDVQLVFLDSVGTSWDEATEK